MLRTFARSAALVLVFGALPAAAYPGGTPNYQTDAAPFCASCHSSRGSGSSRPRASRRTSTTR
jgi:cytochrome c553